MFEFSQDEVAEKKRLIRGLLEETGLTGIYLKKTSNFSWVTAGGYNIVGLSAELGVAGVLLTPDRGYVVCSNIEVPRMEQEERLVEQGYEIVGFPWYEDREASRVASLGGPRLGADHAFPGAADVSGKINPLRYSLTPWEIARYREQARETARAAEETALEIRPGDEERAVVGRLSERLWSQGMDFIVAFCAADDRISRYRHPVATDAKIRTRAMISVNSRRRGLIVSITRFVQFGKVPEDLRRRYEDNVYVDSVMMAATVLDGYPLAKKGQAGKALWVATIASTAGGMVSALCLIFLAPQLARIALKFGPAEYFALMIFGLTIMASVSASSITKGLISGFFGILLSLVGIDPTLGTERFTFGVVRLLTGFSMMPVLIGVFALSEVLLQLELLSEGKLARIPHTDKLGSVVPTKKELKGLWKVILGSSLLGTIIGIIPATGGAIASFMAYNEARRFSKEPETFGTGNLAGIAAPEAANNGTTGGAMVPLITLGIPGDVVTAVMLGALLLIGVHPGPLLFSQTPHIVNNLFAGFMVAQFLILGFGLLSIRVSPLILKAPLAVLFPLILCLCLLGAFSLGNSMYDVGLAIIFGVIGYFMKKHGFSGASLILGLILGPIAERELSRALILSHGNWLTLVSSPIAVGFYVLALASVGYSMAGSGKAGKAKKA